jgi:hypothetical protein
MSWRFSPARPRYQPVGRAAAVQELAEVNHRQRRLPPAPPLILRPQAYAGSLGRHELHSVSGKRVAVRPSVVCNCVLGNNATVVANSNLPLDPGDIDRRERADRRRLGDRSAQPGWINLGHER